MGYHLHASNTDDPPKARIWWIHLMAIIVLMGSVTMGYDTAVIGGNSKRQLDSRLRLTDFAFGSGARLLET